MREDLSNKKDLSFGSGLSEPTFIEALRNWIGKTALLSWQSRNS